MSASRRYELGITVVGRDQATGTFSRIGSSLLRIRDITAGFLLATGIRFLIRELFDLASAAAGAVLKFQMLETSILGLSARELVMTGVGENFKAVESAASTMTKSLMEQLSAYAILSPYQVEHVLNTYRTAQAFGFFSSEAIQFTRATLNMAAGIGADNSMLQRMSYNLAQIRRLEKVTTRDVRDLANAGLDLNAVLRYVASSMGYTIDDFKGFNELIAQGKIEWSEFARLYEEYTLKYFEGASERMARTLFGLQSTFKDVFVLTVPKILERSTEAFTDTANKILDLFIGIRDTPILDQLNKTFGVKIEGMLAPWNNFFDNIAGRIDESKRWRGEFPVFEAIRGAIGESFGPEALKNVDFAIGIFESFGDTFGALKTKIAPVLDWVKTSVQDAFLAFREGGFEGLFEEIGVPTQLINFFDTVKGLGEDLKTFWTVYGPEISTIIGDIFTTLADLGGFSLDLSAEGITSFGDWLIANGPNIVSGLQGFADAFRNDIAPAIKDVANFIKDDLMPNWDKILIGIALAGGVFLGFKLAVATVSAVIGGLIAQFGFFKYIIGAIGLEGFGVAVSSLAPLLATVLPVIGQVALVLLGVGAAIAAVGALFIWAWDTIGPIFAAIGESIAATVGPSFAQLLASLAPLKEAFASLLQAFAPLTPILEAIGAVLVGVIVGAITLVLGVITGLINGLVTAVTVGIQITQQLVTGLGNIFKGLFGVITGIVSVIVNAVKGLFSGDWTGLQTSLAGLGQSALTLLQGLWTTIGAVFSMGIGTVIGFVGGFVEGIIGFFTNLYNTLVGHSIIPELISGMTSLFSGAFGLIGGLFTGDWTGIETSLQSLLLTVTTQMPLITATMTDSFTLGFFQMDAVVLGGVAKINTSLATGSTLWPATLLSLTLKLINILEDTASAFHVKGITWVNKLAQGVTAQTGTLTSAVRALCAAAQAAVTPIVIPVTFSGGHLPGYSSGGGTTTVNNNYNVGWRSEAALAAGMRNSGRTI